MVKRAQIRMVVVIAMALGIAFLGLGYRLVELQVFRHEEMKVKGAARMEQETLIQARRGDILDVRGNALATTESRKLVFVDPSLLPGWHGPLAETIARVLETDASKIEEKLRRTMKQRVDGTTYKNQYEILQKQVPRPVWDELEAAIRELQLELGKTATDAELTAINKLNAAIAAKDEQVRVYPHGSLASHIVGFASTEEIAFAELELSQAKTPPVNQIFGREGIELVFNQKLAGAHGWRVTEFGTRNKKKVELVTQRKSDMPARDGLNVFLTIDTYIQDVLEKALHQASEKHNPISVSGIIVRPSTGEILGMACLPNFDPRNLDSSTLDARRNRNISDVVEPGSTFKIVVTAAALNEDVVELQDPFDCERGYFFYGGEPLRDHHAYDKLTVEEIITKSSNIGAAKIGIRLGEKRLYEYMRAFGFGSRTGVPLLGEVPGIVHPVSTWKKVTLAQIPMGHGVAVTRLQMVMAMAALANKGQLMRPMLIDRLEDRDHNIIAKYTPQRVRQVVSEGTAADMVQALKTVVRPGGTATQAALENYSVAGKTGTAQKVVQGTYSREKFVSSFIGFFPADNPEVCIGVMLDEPRNRKYGYYGGAVAGPVFKQIAEGIAKYLSIAPDLPLTNELRIVNSTAGSSSLSPTTRRER